MNLIITDQNILVTSAIVRELQLSKFEVSKRGLYVAFTETAGVGLLCVKCRRQTTGRSLARLALFKICNVYRKYTEDWRFCDGAS